MTKKKAIRRYFKRIITRIKKSNFYRKYKRAMLVSFLVLVITFLYIQVSLSSLSELRLDFLKLKNDYEASYPCHEDCLLSRQKLRDKVVANFYKDKNIYQDWQKYWQESLESKNYDLQKELLNIALALASDEKISLILADSLLKPGIDSKAKANIINIYFSNIDDSNLADYYFNLLKDADSKIKQSALLAISNLADKEAIISTERFLLIENLILDKTIEKNLTTDLLFLLFELELSSSEQARATLISIYENTSDRVIKYLVAEHLNSLGLNDYSAPELSELEIKNYFFS